MFLPGGTIFLPSEHRNFTGFKRKKPRPEPGLPSSSVKFVSQARQFLGRSAADADPMAVTPHIPAMARPPMTVAVTIPAASMPMTVAVPVTVAVPIAVL